jgi:tRNA (pseudouridine54-N1)-methyltransferase
MTLIFFIKSATVNLNNYTIKDIPGSSGRLDVISRCILAAILSEGDFEKNIQIWMFLDNYGTFIFSPELLDYRNFPKNELKLTDYFVQFLIKSNLAETLNDNPLKSIKTSNMNILEAIKKFKKTNYSIFTLKEEGKDFIKLKSRIQEKKDILFIIGSQEDEFLNSKELLALKIPTISIGNQSYLASSVIKLLKMHILLL